MSSRPISSGLDLASSFQRVADMSLKSVEDVAKHMTENLERSAA
jgi:hypothetical protein